MEFSSLPSTSLVCTSSRIVFAFLLFYTFNLSYFTRSKTGKDLRLCCAHSPTRPQWADYSTNYGIEWVGPSDVSNKPSLVLAASSVADFWRSILTGKASVLAVLALLCCRWSQYVLYGSKTLCRPIVCKKKNIGQAISAECFFEEQLLTNVKWVAVFHSLSAGTLFNLSTPNLEHLVSPLRIYLYGSFVLLGLDIQGLTIALSAV